MREVFAMVRVQVFKGRQLYAEIEFGGELSVLQGNGTTNRYNPGKEKTVQVRGGEVPDVVLTRVKFELCRGIGMGEWEGFNWRMTGPAI